MTLNSPGIRVREVDLTGGIPLRGGPVGAFVGNFRWGPGKTPILIDSEQTLAERFGSPTATTAVDFLSAAQYLRYSSALHVVREYTAPGANASRNATNITDGTNSVDITIPNEDDFASTTLPTAATTGAWVAKYPGALGNSLRVSLCPAHMASFNAWRYKDSFDGPPGTSEYVRIRTGIANPETTPPSDEVHVVVVDQNGLFSGTPGTVLETFAYLSQASDAKTNDGSNNYVQDVINSQSKFVWLAKLNGVIGTAADEDAPTDEGTFSGGLGQNDPSNAAAALTNIGSLSSTDSTFGVEENAIFMANLSNGEDSGTLMKSEYENGFANFEDVDTIQVDFLVAPGLATDTDQTSLITEMVSIAAQKRRDCVVVTSPPHSAVVNIPSPTATFADNFPKSSYLIVDNNYLRVYDKYNDQYVFVPAASSTAGIMAATDVDTAPWFSPAGQRRGQYYGVTSLAYSPTQSQRDVLYKAGVNPIANIPGQGMLLFGDKTHLSRPSAFDRINVRRLFLVIERAISRAARAAMFEFNDEFTRAEFINVVEPFLREIRGRRGITDFRVVCDESNNTAEVIDRNEFIANIFIKPARSINFVTLNFIAVRTGVNFEEIAGTDF